MLGIYVDAASAAMEQLVTSAPCIQNLYGTCMVYEVDTTILRWMRVGENTHTTQLSAHLDIVCRHTQTHDRTLSVWYELWQRQTYLNSGSEWEINDMVPPFVAVQYCSTTTINGHAQVHTHIVLVTIVLHYLYLKNEHACGVFPLQLTQLLCVPIHVCIL